MQRVINNINTLINDNDSSQNNETVTTTIITNPNRTKNAKFNGMTVYSLDKICPICGNGLVTTETSDEGEETVTLVKAENVITNYDRRFISDELLSKIAKVISNYMNIEQFDTDSDGIVDKSKISETVENVTWDEIKEKPDIDINKINETIENSHIHNNINSLNNINKDDNDLPTWNGNNWPYPTKNIKFIPLNESNYRNIIISNDISAIDTNIGDIWFETKNSDEDISKAVINSINIKITDNKWATISINDILVRAANMITPTIYNIIEETQITSHEDMGNLYGGDINGHYHLSMNEYNELKNMINDNSKYYLTKNQYEIIEAIINDYTQNKGYFIHGDK